MLTSYIDQHLPQFKIHFARPEPGISWSAYRNKERGFLVWLVKSKDYQDPLFSLKSALQFYKAQEEQRKLKLLEESTADTLAEPIIPLSSEQIRPQFNVDDVSSPSANKLIDDEVTLAGTPPSGEDSQSLNADKNNSEHDQLDLPKMVAEQLDVVRSNLKKYFQEMAEIEALVNDIWQVNDKVAISASKSSSSSSSDAISSDSIKPLSAVVINNPSEDLFINTNTANEWCVVDDDHFQDVPLNSPQKPKGLLQKVQAKATKISSAL